MKVKRHPRRGIYDWLIQEGLEGRPNAELYLFMLWKEEAFQNKKAPLKVLNNYCEENGYVYEIDDINDWLLMLVKRKE